MMDGLPHRGAVCIHSRAARGLAHLETSTMLQSREPAVSPGATRVRGPGQKTGTSLTTQRAQRTPTRRGLGNQASIRQLKAAPAAPETTHTPGPAPRNDTGLPDGLKAGVESLSGISLDGVKVHYNSSRPAQLQALAYTQGSEIHVGPGQEKHLPHEAWHVVQQAQGRVRPTMQMKGVGVNDDAGLEREADVMGARAVQVSNFGAGASGPLLRMGGAVQRVERRTKLYDRIALGNPNFSENMEILDSLSDNQYVHLSRNSAGGVVNAHAVAGNDWINPNRVRQVDQVDTSQGPVTAGYTGVNNAHITLEGRYGNILSRIANEMWDMRAGIKAGPPVIGGWPNQNFRQLPAPPGGNPNILAAIDGYAALAKAALRANEPHKRIRRPHLRLIQKIHSRTRAMAIRLVNRAPFALNIALVRQYGGGPWPPP